MLKMPMSYGITKTQKVQTWGNLFLFSPVDGVMSYKSAAVLTWLAAVGVCFTNCKKRQKKKKKDTNLPFNIQYITTSVIF